MTQTIYTPEAVETSVLVVGLGTEYYGIPAVAVREIVRYAAFTLVPGAAPALPGVMSRRGAVIPIADLRVLLGLPTPQPTRTTRFVVCSIEEIEVALIVDRVEDLDDLAGSEIESLPPTLDPARARLLRGVVRADERYISLLDGGGLIALLREV
jgi:purine-binding chemotaxis protein CheW